MYEQPLTLTNMKNHLFICVITLLLVNYSFGQNYQTINSGDINYFRNADSGFMIASEIETAFSIEGDSIFLPFKSLRDDDGSNYFLRRGWLGNKIIIKTDGMNLFLNEVWDTLFINTQAMIGEEFIFYHKPDVITINAVVTSITEQVVLGTLDSVKTYLLFSDHPDFDLGSPEIRIGKNSGIIDVFRFYSFPHKYLSLIPTLSIEDKKYELVGSLFPKIGITKPTNFDIHNLEVGDVIQYKEYFDWEGSYEWEKSIRKTVLDKIVVGSDVTYSMEVYSKYFTPPTDGGEEVFIYSTDTISESYSISEDFYWYNLIPEKHYGGRFEDQFELKYTEECGYVESKINHGGERLNDSSIVYNYWHGAKTTSSAIQGANDYYNYYRQFNEGLLYTDGVYLNSLKNELGICGSGEFLETKSFENMAKLLLVYPNPVTNELHIDYDKELKVELINILGEIVQTTNQTEISLSHLETGMYILKIYDTNNNLISVNQVIKN